ncbi:MAG: YdgA family protein [Pseudomonadota bacterium]
MKKLALAMLLAAAYPLATWMLGKTVEQNLSGLYRQMEASSYLKVVRRDYRRGFYRSTDTVTFELSAHPGGAMREGAEPMRLTLRTEILHGPLPGLKTLAAATAESELVLDDATRARLAELMNGQKPLAVHTVYRFDGSGRAEVSSPAFSVAMPADEETPGGKLVWEGMRFLVESDRDMNRYTLAGGAPGLRFEGGDGSAVVMRDLKVEADQARPFADVPMFYTGPTKMSIAEVSVREAFGAADAIRFGSMSFEGQVPMQGDYIDILSRIGVEQVDIAGDNYGPVHYDVSLKHLHARSIASLYAAFMKMYAHPQAEDMAERMKAEMSDPVMELLRHDPEFSLDRISFMTPQGESRLPEALVMMAAALDESASLARGMVALEREGHIRNEGGMLAIQARFARGQLSLNGKPFDPMAFSAAASPEMEPALEAEAAEDLPVVEEAAAAPAAQD